MLMRTFKTLLFTIVFLAVTSLSAAAQTSCPECSEAGSVMSAKERAEWRTDEVDKVVNLDGRQYKKIYRIFLREERAIESIMDNCEAQTIPPYPNEVIGSRGMGNGYPRGPVGNLRIQWYSRVSHGEALGGESASGTQEISIREIPVPAVAGKEIDSKEYLDAREANLRTILTQEQYALWNRLHADL